MAQADVLVANLRTPLKGVLVSVPPRKRKAASYREQLRAGFRVPRCGNCIWERTQYTRERASFWLFHGHGFSSDPQGEESKALNVREKSGWIDMDQTLEVRKKLRLGFPSTTHLF